MAKSILVVEDSKTVRAVLKGIAETLGFVVSQAEDGQQALDQCKQSLPDGILLDWNMPVMDGIEFLRKLRSLPNGNSPRVVFCSTENDLKYMKEAIAAGAQDYIIKPFDEKVIREKFTKVGLI